MSPQVDVLGQVRTLDRVPRFDKRSRRFGVAAVVPEGKVPRSYTWACALVLDQGEDGACVGHAFAHDGYARPVTRQVRSADAFALYRRAQQIDQWPGEDYQGTSILAGAKAYVEAGYASGYRWGFGLADLIMGVGYAGPAVLGLGWRTGMFHPSADGWITASGTVEGGHAVLARQSHLVWKRGTTPAQKRSPGWLERVDLDRAWVLLHNSWGGTWGDQGCARISLRNLAVLLADDGECCFPVARA